MSNKNLILRCEELVEWSKTGVLKEGALRRLAKQIEGSFTSVSSEPDRKILALRVAEDRTKMEALEFVIKHGPLIRAIILPK